MKPQYKIIQDVGYKYGHSVILEKEPQNVYKGKSCEGFWDTLKFEVAGAESGTPNNIRNALKHCASKPDSKIAVLFFPNGNYSSEKFQIGLAKFNGLKGTSQHKIFDLIYCIQGDKIIQIKSQVKTWLERERVSKGYPIPRIAKVWNYAIPCKFHTSNFQ